MTLGLFLTASAAIIALVEIVIFTGMRNKGRLSEAIYPVIVMASVGMPFLVYAVMYYLMPDTGAKVIF